MASQSLTEILKSISKDWISYRKASESLSKTGAKIRTVNKNHYMYDLIIHEWSNKISERVNLKKYKVESKLGDGNLSAGPWLAIMDRSLTETATEEYYVVYLFSRSAKKLYLSIGIGATQFQEIYGMTNLCIEKLELATNEFRNLFDKYKPSNCVDKIDILEDHLTFEPPLKSSSRNLNKLYEKGVSFSKEYNLENISDELLFSDLSKYINIYKNIIEDPKSENLNILAETLITKNELEKNQKNKIEYDYELEDFKPSPKKKKLNKVTLSSLAKNKKRTQDSKLIGKKGENYVCEYEKQKLKKLNRKDLAAKVYNHDDNNEFPGWDITSYDKNGEEIFIEVKSARKSKTVFNITASEWKAAEKQGDKYFIYLVENALNDKIRIVSRIKNPLKYAKENKIEVKVSTYEIRL